jgi:hypothetical protein
LSSTGIAISTGGINAGQRGCPGTGAAGSAVLMRVPRGRRDWHPAPLAALAAALLPRGSRLGVALRRSWRPFLDRRWMEIRRGKTAGSGLADALDMRDVVMRQLAGARERPRYLQEAEAH